jgi:tRNA uridine 5-carbamoylmethylation protein Kti12
MSNSTRVSLVLVSGPPGIGKTQFTCAFANFIQTQADHFQPLKLHYDEIIDKQLESRLIESNEWKRGRDAIKQLVQQLIEYLLLIRPLNTSESLYDYLARKNETITSVVDSTLKRNFLESIKNLDNSLASQSTDFHYFILLDDNFYYESMRHSFYKVCCLATNCSYFSICFKTQNVDLLFERNSARELNSRVEKDVLVNIFDKFEYPKEWESKCSMIVEEPIGLSCFDLEAILSAVIANHCTFIEFLDERKKEMPSHITNDAARSLLHECDLILRKLVREKLNATMLVVAEKKEIERIGRELATKKTNTLNQIKANDSELYTKLNALSDFNLIENELRSKIFDE